MFWDMPGNWADSSVFFIMVVFALAFKTYLIDHILFFNYFKRKNHKRNWVEPLLAQAAAHGAVFTVLLFPLFGLTLSVLAGLVEFALRTCVEMCFRWFKSKYNVFNNRYWYLDGAQEQISHLLTFTIVLVSVVFRFSFA